MSVLLPAVVGYGGKQHHSAAVLPYQLLQAKVFRLPNRSVLCIENRTGCRIITGIQS